ncbi:MAG: hypothetical protein VX154_01270 [Pseudomonadota bacterium]|nr:hypothetical protein [Pseudomonadota bacterium]
MNYRNIVLWGVTLLLILLFILILIGYIKSPSGVDIGGLLAGFSAAVAFVWLIAGFYQQSTELSLQRVELSLQRVALEQQRNEFRELNKQQTLSHIKHIMDMADSRLGGFREKPLLDTVNAFVNDNLSVVLKSTNASEVSASSIRYYEGLNPIKAFFEEYKMCLCMVMEMKGVSYQKGDDLHFIEFIYRYSPHSKDVPYLLGYHNSIFSTTNLLIGFKLKTINDSVVLATLSAQASIDSTVVHLGKLKKLNEKFIADYGREALPALSLKYYEEKLKDLDEEDESK